MVFIGIFFGSILIGTSLVRADDNNVVDIVFAGGQSNATDAWAGKIKKGLETSGKFSNLQVVHVRHSGNWLKHWYQNGPKKNFHADFYNEAGTGALETVWKEVEASGKTPRFSGFFWFQGEADSKSIEAQKVYAERFNKILALLPEHFKMASSPNFAVAIIDANSAPKYYCPNNPKGRTHEQIDGMRAVLKKLGEQANGVAVDTHGAKRVDMWHVRGLDNEKIGVKIQDGQCILEKSCEYPGNQ